MFMSFLPKQEIENLGLKKYISIDELSLCGDHSDTHRVSVSPDFLKVRGQNKPNAFDLKLWSNSENELIGFLKDNLEIHNTHIYLLVKIFMRLNGSK